MLQGYCRVIVQSEWKGEDADALIALHARRSAASIAAFHEARPDRRIALVLTGTDLYRDLAADDAVAQASLDVAHRLIALQDDAPGLLAARWRAKCEVIFQSARQLTTARKPREPIEAVVVGHLREEKDPRTVFEAAALLPPGAPVRITHIGAGLDLELAREARALARREPRYHYLGALPHGLTRAAIKRAHVLVHPSIMEGGANVIAEAICSGTPVLASRMSGNLGMLGRDYPGYFEVRDASGLAHHLVRLHADRSWLPMLKTACAVRAPLFRPTSEARAVRRLVANLLA
jgi:putative glycosyltransferase (TIGR04348 family)